MEPVRNAFMHILLISWARASCGVFRPRVWRGRVFKGGFRGKSSFKRSGICFGRQPKHSRRLYRWKVHRLLHPKIFKLPSEGDAKPAAWTVKLGL